MRNTVGAGKGDVKPKLKFDFGTPELRKRFEFAVEETDNYGTKAVRVYSHPLDFYYRKRQKDRPLINQRQKDAGNALQRDFDKGCYLRYGVASYAREKVDCAQSGVGLSDTQEDARQRLTKAMKFLADDISIEIAISVCCFGLFMKDITIPYYESTNQSMARLREVLDRLGDFYGMQKYHYVYPKRKVQPEAV
jgi:hypothetical protein